VFLQQFPPQSSTLLSPDENNEILALVNRKIKSAVLPSLHEKIQTFGATIKPDNVKRLFDEQLGTITIWINFGRNYPLCSSFHEFRRDTPMDTELCQISIRQSWLISAASSPPKVLLRQFHAQNKLVFL
jgi:hypothetical protein